MWSEIKSYFEGVREAREGEKSKVIVMFQNDKTAIYEFIFIDHIVFIFTAFVREFKRVNAWRQM
jgi:hypothetical protein